MLNPLRPLTLREVLLFAVLASAIASSAAGVVAWAWQTGFVSALVVTQWSGLTFFVFFSFTLYFGAAHYDAEHRLTLEQTRGMIDFAKVARTPAGYTPMAQTVETAFNPNLVLLAEERGYAKTLHITPAQLNELKKRIERGDLGLPVNNVQGFSSTEMLRLRNEAQVQDLAYSPGNNKIRWTEEGAALVAAASPAPLVKGRRWR